MNSLLISVKSLLGKIPQLSIGVIILGLSKQIIYYKNYDLPIEQYITLSEIGLLIANDLYLIFLFLTVFFVEIFVLDFSSKEEGRKIDKKVFSENQVNNTSYRIVKIVLSIIKWSALVVFGIIFVGFMLTPFIGVFTAESYPEKLFMGVLALSISIVFILIFRTNQIAKHFGFVTIPITLLLLAILGVYYLSIPDQLKKVDNGYYYGTKIIMSDTIYVSDRNDYYIGQTSKYIFIYSKLDSATTIIPLTKVDKIVLKTNKAVKGL